MILAQRDQYLAGGQGSDHYRVFSWAEAEEAQEASPENS
jgi:hypothetical protein